MTRGLFYKTFNGRNLQILWVRHGAYPSEAAFRCSTLG